MVEEVGEVVLYQQGRQGMVVLVVVMGAEVVEEVGERREMGLGEQGRVDLSSLYIRRQRW